MRAFPQRTETQRWRERAGEIEHSCLLLSKRPFHLSLSSSPPPFGHLTGGHELIPSFPGRPCHHNKRRPTPSATKTRSFFFSPPLSQSSKTAGPGSLKIPPMGVNAAHSQPIRKPNSSYSPPPSPQRPADSLCDFRERGRGRRRIIILSTLNRVAPPHDSGS